MSFLGKFNKSPTIDIFLNPRDTNRQKQRYSSDPSQEPMLIYYDGETVCGHIIISLDKVSKFEHQGIQVELVGQLVVNNEKSNFLCMQRELANPGILNQNCKFPFEFANVEKRFESYHGKHAKLRYMVRVTISKRIGGVIKEEEFLVHTLAHYPDMPNRSVTMEVGIHESLVIELEYDKSKYHLKDVIVGKIFFLQVRVKITKMEIQIIRQETTGGGTGCLTSESEVVVRHEIMDGGPGRGESIPFRMFLTGYDLVPTMRDVNKRFSVINFLNLVLVDEDARRYYKQQEIFLYRRMDGKRLKKSPIASSALIQQVQNMMLRDSDTPSNNNADTDSNTEDKEKSAGDANSSDSPLNNVSKANLATENTTTAATDSGDCNQGSSNDNNDNAHQTHLEDDSAEIPVEAELGKVVEATVCTTSPIEPNGEEENDHATDHDNA